LARELCFVARVRSVPASSVFPLVQLLLLLTYVPLAWGHGAVTNPVPRMLASKPYCAWCVGEHVEANPPGAVHYDARLSSPCMGTSRGDQPYPLNHWGHYRSIVGDSALPTYKTGETVQATIVLDADHNGEALWQYCPHSDAETEECFWNHPLVDWTDVHSYFGYSSAGEHLHSGEHYPQSVHLPAQMHTGPVTLRWLWVCKNTDELFTSCIDAEIGAGGPTTSPTPPLPTATPTIPPPSSSPVPTDASAATCPTPGNGLPDWAATCGCDWTQDGAQCQTAADDGSECFCQCCCACSGKCAYAGHIGSGNSGSGNSGSGGDSCTMPGGILDTVPDKYNEHFIDCHGKLRVEGVQLVDVHGLAVQLMGMSSHGLHWFPDCYTKSSIQYLVMYWGINLFRAALYVGEGGYAQQPELKDRVKEVVQWCKELGIYVIIDWHVLTPGDPNAATYSGAIPFFEEMANTYRDDKHVLFEICNEPNGVTWPTVKSYADSVISAIRAIDSETVILVGTPTWSQDIHLARQDPVSSPQNVMYAFHFYAGTHMSFMSRVRDEAALIPIFVTEWGTSQASGDGGPYLQDAKMFLDLFNDASGQKISWAQWSYADKNEQSAALSPGACSSKEWDETSCSGTFVRNYIKMYSNTCAGSTPAPPVPTVQPTATTPSPAPTSTATTPNPTVPPTMLPTATPAPPVPTALPTAATSSTATCSDTPMPWMISNGINCDTASDVTQCTTCKNSAWWSTQKFCQQSCFEAGCGYDGDDCSRATPAPTSTATIPNPTVPPTMFPTATPPSTTPATGSGAGSCHNVQCGCPPFTAGASWCDAQNSLIAGDWCSLSAENCANCSHTWCPSARRAASVDAVLV